MPIRDESLRDHPRTDPIGPCVESDPVQQDTSSTSARHGRYYLDDSMSIFLVENTYFKVHRFHLVKESEVFHWMFMCPPKVDGPEGGTDQSAIPLPDVTCKEFECLLDFFYTSMHASYDPSLEEWCCLLSIATRFDFENVRQRAISEIDSPRFHRDLDPIKKSVLATKFSIQHWHAGCYEALCQRSEGLNDNEAQELGVITANRIWRAREEIRGSPQRPDESFFGQEHNWEVPIVAEPLEPTVWDLENYHRGTVSQIVSRVFWPPTENVTTQ